MAEQLRRYAEGTEVDVTTTQADIKRLLSRHGASQFMIAEGHTDAGELIGFIQFRIHSRMVKYTREYPGPDDYLYDGRNIRRRPWRRSGTGRGAVAGEHCS